jgi:glutaconate CoA-transferase, subunit A
MTAMTTMTTLSIRDVAARIADGASLALPPDYSGCAMAVIKALIERQARDLHLIGVPSLGFQGDWLIGAGCVRMVETAAMTLGEHGLPPRFNAAIKAGQIKIKDATCPAIHAGLQAAEKGIPFMPLRGILGSDLLQVRPDWKVVDNPFTPPGDKIVLIPAIRPDVTLFHAAKADRNGNVWIGVRRELMLMAHAARETFVTVEEIVDADFLSVDEIAAGTIPALYISGYAVAERGAEPIGLAGVYGADEMALAAYTKAAQTAQGFAQWLAENVKERELA